MARIKNSETTTALQLTSCLKSATPETDNTLIIRPWRPGDEKGTWGVLKEGSFSNVPISVLLLLKKRMTTAVVFILVSFVLAYTGSYFAALLMVAVTLCSIYCVMWLIAVIYLYGPPLWDMRSVLKTYFLDDDSRFWVAEMHGKIIGTIAIVKQIQGQCGHQTRCTAKSSKVAWLRRMAVLRECRGQGVARLLVETAVQFCNSRNYNKVELITTEVHQAARRLYEKCGFKCITFQPHKYCKGLVRIWTYEYELRLKD